MSIPFHYPRVASRLHGWAAQAWTHAARRMMIQCRNQASTFKAHVSQPPSTPRAASPNPPLARLPPNPPLPSPQTRPALDVHSTRSIQRKSTPHAIAIQWVVSELGRPFMVTSGPGRRGPHSNFQPYSLHTSHQTSSHTVPNQHPQVPTSHALRLAGTH